MTNLQLALTIGIPSLLVSVGIFLNNARFNSIDGRFNSIDGRFNDVGGRLNTIESDLRQFYSILGRHDAEIANLKDRQRSA